jgi:hypothetical protein
VDDPGGEDEALDPRQDQRSAASGAAGAAGPGHLAELRPLTGHGQYVFPSLLTGERGMSENTIRAALRRMGYSNDDMTAHGFRAMARTLMVERLAGISADVIEAQLAHGKSRSLGMAYDRAEFMAQVLRFKSPVARSASSQALALALRTSDLGCVLTKRSRAPVVIR